eukprot:203928_1
MSSLSEVIRFRSSVDKLNPTEFNDFILTFVQKCERNILITSLFTTFLSQLHSSSNQQESNQPTLNIALTLLKQIIASRKPKRQHYPCHVKRLQSLSSELIGNLASYLNLADYKAFCKVNRIVYIGCNSPNTLQHVHLKAIMDHSLNKEPSKQMATMGQLHREIYALKTQLRTSNKEANSFKLMANAYRDACLNGCHPRREMFGSISKCNDMIERSSTASLWRQQRMNLFGNTKITKHNSKYLSKDLLQALAVWCENNEYTANQNPWITLDEGKRSMNDVLEVFDIGSDHRCKALTSCNQKGARSKTQIPKHTVLGRYLGFESTEEEWSEVFDYSNKETHGEYLYKLSWNEHVDGDGNICASAPQGEKTRMNLMIDPLEGGYRKYPLIYINDCRKTLTEDALTDEDATVQNVKFIEATVQGWPSVFVVTKRDIQNGEELLLDYGKDYSRLVMENKRWNQMIDHDRRNIDEHIQAPMYVQLDDCYNLSVYESAEQNYDSNYDDEQWAWKKNGYQQPQPDKKKQCNKCGKIFKMEVDLLLHQTLVKC